MIRLLCQFVFFVWVIHGGCMLLSFLQWSGVFGQPLVATAIMCSWPCMITTIKKICITQYKTVRILQVEHSYVLNWRHGTRVWSTGVSCPGCSWSCSGVFWHNGYSCPCQTMTPPPLRLGKLLVKLLLLFEVGGKLLVVDVSWISRHNRRFLMKSTANDDLKLF